MSKFGGPHFRSDENVVSVFVAKCPVSEIPIDYFEENCSDEDDEPFNQFSDDFGFGYYDHDFVEGASLKGEAPIQDVISSASYGYSFARNAGASTTIQGTEHIFLMYNFRYDPTRAGISETAYYKFIGVFTYDPSA